MVTAAAVDGESLDPGAVEPFPLIGLDHPCCLALGTAGGFKGELRPNFLARRGNAPAGRRTGNFSFPIGPGRRRQTSQTCRKHTSQARQAVVFHQIGSQETKETKTCLAASTRRKWVGSAVQAVPSPAKRASGGRQQNRS